MQCIQQKRTSKSFYDLAWGFHSFICVVHASLEVVGELGRDSLYVEKHLPSVASAFIITVVWICTLSCSSVCQEFTGAAKRISKLLALYSQVSNERKCGVV